MKYDVSATWYKDGCNCCALCTLTNERAESSHGLMVLVIGNTVIGPSDYVRLRINVLPQYISGGCKTPPIGKEEVDKIKKLARDAGYVVP